MKESMFRQLMYDVLIHMDFAEPIEHVYADLRSNLSAKYITDFDVTNDTELDGQQSLFEEEGEE